MDHADTIRNLSAAEAAAEAAHKAATESRAAAETAAAAQVYILLCFWLMGAR